MAWVKIPKENHPLFHECLPRDPRVSTVNMFGGVAAKVNGQMFAGLFARGAVVKLSASDQQVALALDGAEMFDPMGNGRIMRDTVFLPPSVLDDRDELRGWLRKALDYTAALPRKQKRPMPKRVAKAPAMPKTAAKKSVPSDRRTRAAIRRASGGPRG